VTTDHCLLTTDKLAFVSVLKGGRFAIAAILAVDFRPGGMPGTMVDTPTGIRVIPLPECSVLKLK